MRARTLLARQNDLAKADEAYRIVICDPAGTRRPGLGSAKALVRSGVGANRSARTCQALNRCCEKPSRFNGGSRRAALFWEEPHVARQCPTRPVRSEWRRAVTARGRRHPGTAGARHRRLRHRPEQSCHVCAGGRGAFEAGRGTVSTARSGILDRTEPVERGHGGQRHGHRHHRFLARQLAEAEPVLSRALALEERLAPGTATRGRVLNNLGDPDVQPRRSADGRRPVSSRAGDS